MPDKTVPPTRHYGHVNNNKKKKKHPHLVIALGVLAVAVLIGGVILGNHMEFTPDGVRFTFREGEEENRGSADGITLPQPVVDEAAFSPKVKPTYNIVNNGLPPAGPPQLEAAMLDIRSKTEDTLAAHAKWLAEVGAEYVVVDIKGLDGRLSYGSSSRMSCTDGSINTSDTKLANFIAECKANGIKTVGVIHCFADNTIPRVDSTHALKTSTGAIFIDDRHNTWLDPEDEAVQQYILDLVSEAAHMGFREIILDEFCYPLPGTEGYVSQAESRTELLMGLLEQVHEAADGMRMGVVIYDDVAGEGFSETRGQEILRIDELCDHIWMHIGSLSESITYHGSLANLTADGGAKLCVEFNGEYLSDGYYIERYKQEIYALNNAEAEEAEE